MASVSGRRSVTVSPAPGRLCDLDGSVQRFHVAADHVHAHAAAGNIGDLARGRETRRQDQREDFRFREPRRSVDQPLLDGAGAHRLRIQAAPVVRDADQHVRAGVRRRKVDARLGILAGRAPGFRGLDAVIHAVADQMHQRIVQLVDHGLVEFGVGALDGELDFLVQLDSQIVHQPAESLEGGSERQHADAHRVFAQLAGQPLHCLGDFQDFGILGARRGFAQAGLHRDQLPDQVDQLIQLIGRHANGRAAWRPPPSAPPETPWRCIGARRPLRFGPASGTGSMVSSLSSSTKMKMSRIASRGAPVVRTMSQAR